MRKFNLDNFHNDPFLGTKEDGKRREKVKASRLDRLPRVADHDETGDSSSIFTHLAQWHQKRGSNHQKRWPTADHSMPNALWRPDKN